MCGGLLKCDAAVPGPEGWNIKYDRELSLSSGIGCEVGPSKNPLSCPVRKVKRLRKKSNRASLSS